MPQVPYWNDVPLVWDGIRIGSKGSFAPGIVEDVRVQRELKVDEKDGPGVDGATVTTQGRKLAKVAITLKLYNRRHLERLGYLLEALLPEGQAGKPFDMVHPILTMHRLKSLLPTGFTGPTRTGPGVYSFTIECLEFRAPKPGAAKVVTSTPKTSIPTTFPTKTPQTYGPLAPSPDFKLPEPPAALKP